MFYFIVRGNVKFGCSNSNTCTNFDVKLGLNHGLRAQTRIFESSKVGAALLTLFAFMPGRVTQSVGLLTRKSGVLGSIISLATYFRFSLRFFKKGSCQLLAKVCAQNTG